MGRMAVLIGACVAIPTAQTLSPRMATDAKTAKGRGALPAKHLSGATWFGGKNLNASSGIGRWVFDLLPAWEKNQSYIEPFCGMLGILLARRPCDNEVVNDLDERIVNFWIVVRDTPEEFLYLISNTPWAETVFAWAEKAQWDTAEEPLKRALAFLIVCSSHHARKEFIWGTVPSSGGRFGAERRRPWDKLSERLRDVTILQTDALDILKKTANEKDAVVYCDPPYRGTKSDTYSEEASIAPDIDEMVELLQIQEGKVAISGYGDEWDILGWEKHERETYTPLGTTKVANQKVSGRTESLWCNYSAVHQAAMELI